MNETISFTLNGKPVSVTTDTDRVLLWVLRSDLGVTGLKFGCGQGACGACTVLIGNRAARSCITPIQSVKGKKILTIDGLAKDGKLHPLQKAFAKHGAMQCGFCTSGMIMTAYSFLLKNPEPTREQIVNGMEYNLCRCGAHMRIIRAIESAAQEMKGVK
jgi:aerobic-type carbon monoxide dehydrogenase small subunit (CoxS/CutS family)